KLRVVSVIRGLPCAAVLQARSTFLPVAFPQALCLPIAHAHQPRCIHHTQLPTPYARQHLYSSQLPLAHLRPPQSDLLSEVLLRGHFYRGQKGTLSSRYNTCLSQETRQVVRGEGFQDVVIRCKEITLNEKGRATIEDSTVLYGLAKGQFR